MSLNRFIDHTLLSPVATIEQVEKHCEEAVQHNFATVCIPPFYIDLARRKLKGSDVKICTVIGFPFGYDHIATKMEAISRAIDMGADELDIVINLPAVKNGKWDLIESEIDNFVTASKLKGNKIMKLILETAYLNSEELKLLCNLCIKYNVDFAKTSTGYGPRGASLEDVIAMKSFLGDAVQIKASGGIKTKKFAKELINAGATRLGSSSGIKLI
ncbi:MAG: deoxyribose-phosphate aldolase [Saprospiraceae bacterium]|nr:deoxyribose-phosphate aldolase [Saprospiraceae bacterium]